MKRIIVMVLAVLLYAGSSFAQDPFAALKQELVEEGLDPAFIAGVYDEPSVQFTPRLILANFTIKESKLNYGQFLKPKVVARCKDYYQDNKETLDKAYKEYGVSPEIVVAILMVETRLGTYTGKFGIVNVLSTFAAASDPELMKTMYDQLPPEAKQEYSFDRFRKYCLRKSQWAYEELKAFLKYAYESGISAPDKVGSMSGALGYPQFLPSNIERFGRDGNGDGAVDLFNHGDAQASIANYLRAHGWKEDLTVEQKRKVLFSYNRSMPYVNTLLALAAAMKE